MLSKNVLSIYEKVGIFNILTTDLFYNDQKKLINRISLLKFLRNNGYKLIDFFIPNQKHTNLIYNLSDLMRNSILKEDEFDGIFFTNKELDVLKYIGIGVLTADCLPIVILVYSDSLFLCGGVIHAGWRGIFSNILLSFFSILDSFLYSLNNNLGNIIIYVYIGPCIRKCCYKVDQNFISFNNIHSKYISSYKDIFFVDLVSIFKDQFYYLINTKYNFVTKVDFIDVGHCTFCSNRYFSYRKGDTNQRNLTCLFI